MLGSTIGDSGQVSMFDSFKDLYSLPWLYDNRSSAQKASDSIAKTVHRYHLSCERKLVLLDLFLGNLIYYQNEYEYKHRIHTETNTNTNKVNYD